MWVLRKIYVLGTIVFIASPGLPKMDEAITIVGLSVIILALLVFIPGIIGLNSSVEKAIAHRLSYESLRRERIDVRWITKDSFVVVNRGNETVIRYIYLFSRDSEIPFSIVEVDDHLGSGESKIYKLMEIDAIDQPEAVSQTLNQCPPDSGHTTSKYYLCPDGYSGSNCDDACFDISSANFPNRDRLDYGVFDYSYMKKSGVGEIVSSYLPSIDPEFSNPGYNWSICTWLKVSEVGAGNDRLLGFADRELQGTQYPEGMFFLYRDATGNIYAVVKWHAAQLVIGRDENYGTSDEWHLYCITINGTHAVFYIDGMLVGTATNDFESDPTALSWLSFDKIVHSDYWVDTIFVSPTTLNQGDILSLYHTGVLNDIPHSVTFSFDYLPEPIRVEIITERGNRFVSYSNEVGG